MTPIRTNRSPSDRALRIALRVAVLVLALTMIGFGVTYYLGQHVDAGPGLADRQVTAAEQAVRTAPNNLAPRLALAQAYASAHRYDDALAQYAEILSAEPDHRAALLGKAGVLYAKGDLAGAAVAYHKITAEAVKGEFAGADPQLQEAHYFLALIANRQGQPQTAMTEAKAALAIEPTDSDAWYVLGTAQLQLGKAKDAVTSLRQAVLFVPTGWCDPYSKLTDAYRTLGKQPEAEYATAMVDFCQKRPDAARQRLETLTTSTIGVDAMLGLGMVDESSGQRDQAITWYRKVLSVDSHNQSAVTALSRLGVSVSTKALSGNGSAGKSATGKGSAGMNSGPGAAATTPSTSGSIDPGIG